TSVSSDETRENTTLGHLCSTALTARLTAEAQHPIVVVGEISDPHVPSGSHQQQSSYMDKLQQLLTQRQPSQTQQNQPQ
uniref:Uncharacterized protein n=1 Tax=Oryza glaberrima TaxID=4538 RepID=I1PJ51_ORYGL